MKTKKLMPIMVGVGAILFIAAGAGAYMYVQDEHAENAPIKAAAVASQPAPAQQAVIIEQQPTIAQNCDDKNLVGKVIGGAAGGIAGSQIGGGTGKTAATIGGTLGGAILGENYIPTKNATCPK